MRSHNNPIWIASMGAVLYIVAISFIVYALMHPESGFNGISMELLFLLYKLYLVVMYACLIIGAILLLIKAWGLKFAKTSSVSFAAGVLAVLISNSMLFWEPIFGIEVWKGGLLHSFFGSAVVFYLFLFAPIPLFIISLMSYCRSVPKPDSSSLAGAQT